MNGYEEFLRVTFDECGEDDGDIGPEFTFLEYIAQVSAAQLASISAGQLLNPGTFTREKTLKINISQLVAFVKHDVTSKNVGVYMTGGIGSGSGDEWKNVFNAQKVAAIKPFLEKCLMFVL